MVLALDNAGGGGPVVVDSAPAAMKMSELMTEIIVCDATNLNLNFFHDEKKIKDFLARDGMTKAMLL